MAVHTSPQSSIFKQGDTLTLRLVIVVLLSLFLIAIDHRFDKDHRLRVWAENITAPVQRLIDIPFSLIDWFAEGIKNRTTLQEEVAGVRSRNLMLRQKLMKLEAIESENRRLQILLDASLLFGSTYQDDPVLLTKIVAVDLDALGEEVVLDKGSSEGVYPGQPLMDGFGVMGQVVRTTAHSSTALLLSSPLHSIPVQNRRNGLRSIATGNGDPNRLSLRFVATDSDLIEGDTFITSGLGGRFPYGYPVGTVEQITTDSGSPFAEVILTPAARLEQSRELLLVWPANSPGRERP